MSRPPDDPPVLIFHVHYTPAAYGEGGIAYASWGTLVTGPCPQHVPVPHYHAQQAALPVLNQVLRYEDVQALPVPVIAALAEAIAQAHPQKEGEEEWPS